MKLTAKELESKGACASQVALFRSLFGEEVEITEELCAEHASAFDFDWAARNLLTAAALVEYGKIMAAARAAKKYAKA